MKIKVCGITNNIDLAKVSTLNPDYLGFIFYPPSLRDVTDKIANLDLPKIPYNIKKVAVFVNESPETITKIVEKYRFEFVQLHGDESPEMCFNLQKITRVIKAFRIADTLPKNLCEYNKCCDYFLFDTAGEQYGGNGIGFNHSLLKKYNLETPYFLSGGISAQDTTYLSLIRNDKLHAVDINSRFEVKPGQKDIEKLKIFFSKLKQ